MLAAMAFAAGCSDEPLFSISSGDGLSLTVSVPDGWTAGISEGPARKPSKCADVRSVDSPFECELYLHTLVEDADSCSPASTRGTMINGREDFHQRFSLSATRKEGNKTEVLGNDLTYSIAADEETVTPDGDYVKWGKGGTYTFYAFAPCVADAPTVNGSKALEPVYNSSSGTLSGFSYTVPDKIEDQTDLMVARTSTECTYTNVNLSFSHALTAVKIKAEKNEHVDKVKSVSLKNVRTKGTYDFSTAKWTVDEETVHTYTAEAPATGDEASTVSLFDGELTLLMIPQQLEGIELEFVFTDTFLEKDVTLTVPLGDDAKWEAGKPVTYTISPENFSAVAYFDINAGEWGKVSCIPTRDGNELTVPYYGIIEGAVLKIYSEVTWANGDHTETKLVYPESLDNIMDGISIIVNHDSEKIPGDLENIEIIGPVSDNPEDGILVNLRFIPNKNFEDMSTANASVIFPHYEYRSGWRDKYKIYKITKTNTSSDKDNPIDLSVRDGETANCYVIDATGWYKLPLVYGNAIKEGRDNSMAYTSNTGSGITNFVDYKDQPITQPYIEGAESASIVWQDARDLVRNVSLNADKSYLVFQIDEDTVQEGNAVVAVKDENGLIMWSWHIWVTPAKDVLTDAYSFIYYKNLQKCFNFCNLNLGQCTQREKTEQPQPTNNTITYEGRFKINYPKAITVNVDAEAQIAIKMEDLEFPEAGSNTYYQWGRKDPMPRAILVDGKFTEKKLFDGSFEINKSGKVTIGYTIQHPDEFIKGDGVEWHDPTATYLNGEGNKLLHNLWNSTSEGPGEIFTQEDVSGKTAKDRSEKLSKAENFPKETKTIYDPSPAGYRIGAIGNYQALIPVVCQEEFPGFDHSGTGFDSNSFTSGEFGVSSGFTQIISYVFFGGKNVENATCQIHSVKHNNRLETNIYLTGQRGKDGDACYKNTLCLTSSSLAQPAQSGLSGQGALVSFFIPTIETIVVEDEVSDLREKLGTGGNYYNGCGIGISSTLGLTVRPIADE